MPRTVPGARTRPTARRALDRRFETLRPLVKSATAPRGGWIRAIREALGMSSAELATRMGNTDTAVLKLEQSEREGRARLDTLQRAAAALDCDLVVALVPRKPLEEMVTDRATEKARILLGAVDHSMMLEDQRVSSAAARNQLDDLVANLRDQQGLWRD
jgi:predicted DNA-binding mobile mystery protein A